MWIWAIIIIGAIWYFSRRTKETIVVHPAPKEELPTKSEINEERVFEMQTEFEGFLEETHLPDAIPRDKIYVYKNLMRPWFNKLVSQNRYNDGMTQKLREDFLDYMYALQQKSTSNYLSMESEVGSEEEKKHESRRSNAVKKVNAIEDAFAASVGQEAVEELSSIRTKDFSVFSSSGQLAPDGFEYDFDDDKLVKKDKE